MVGIQSKDFLFTKSVIRTAEKLSKMERMVGLMLRRVEHLQHDADAGLALSSCRKALQTGVKELRKYAHQKIDKSLQKLLISIPGIDPVVFRYYDIRNWRYWQVSHWQTAILHLLFILP